MMGFLALLSKIIICIIIVVIVICQLILLIFWANFMINFYRKRKNRQVPTLPSSNINSGSIDNDLDIINIDDD